jgi:predicted GIY-YIG superfamily endonuclease
MNTAFVRFVETLEPKFQSLIAMKAVRYAGLPSQMPERGIYLFSEGANHLYVGRTNRIRRRLAGHCRPSSTHFSATFAFRIARKETGLLKATYTTKGSRAELVKDPIFGPAFTAAKTRLANMDLRFVDEDDPVRQALLEIYVAVALKTPFNDFDNH